MRDFFAFLFPCEMSIHIALSEANWEEISGREQNGQRKKKYNRGARKKRAAIVREEEH